MEQNIIKAIALMQHKGETFYIANGTAYTDEAMTDKVTEYDEDNYNNDYLVLTDDEATEKANENIKEGLWTFDADFICSQVGLPSEAQEMVNSFCCSACERANDTILAMVEESAGGLEGFQSAAIQAYGRGHFISFYDREENEVTVVVDGENHTFYIYRMN